MTGRIALAALLAAATAWGGELTRRRDRTLERVLNGGPPRLDTEFLLADLVPSADRRFADFSGDLSGRALGALAALDLEAAVELALRVFALQSPDGGFAATLSAGAGATDVDMALLWGHGRLLAGLVEFYEATGDARALESARRLGDYLAGAAPRFNAAGVRRAYADGKRAYGYVCWLQNVEGLAALGRATGEARFLEAARSVATGIERRPGQHAHGWLSALRGAAGLAAVTGDAGLLAQVEVAWESFAASENLLWTGGPPEYFAPGIDRDEGCASADWVRLNLDLWRATRRSRYLDAAETALFGAFFLNQFASGDFGHVKLAADGFGYGGSRAWWCCTLHGLRAFRAIAGSAFGSVEGELRYELAIDGVGEANGLRVRASADLAVTGRATLHIETAPEPPAALRVRLPGWAESVATPYGSSRGSDLRIERVWRPGESFEIGYEFRLEQSGDRVRLGPWLLGVSEAGDPAYFDEGYERHRPNWTSLAVADRPSRLRVDYESAGYGAQPARAVLRPLAERWESSADGLRWRAYWGETRAPRERPAWLLPGAAGFGLGAALGLFARFRRRVRAG